MEQTTFAKKTVVLAALGALSLMAATVRAADETETEPAPEAKAIEVTIGAGASVGTVIGSTIDSANEKVEWNDAWLKEVFKDNETFGGLTFKEAGIITVNGEGSFSIDLPTKEETAAGNDGKYVTFNGVNLTVEKGGTFSNSSYLKFTDGGSLTVAGAEFNNGKDGVIAFEGTTFSIDAGFSLDAEDKDTLGNFENAGLIILDADADQKGATMSIGSIDGALREVTSEDKFSLNVGNVEIKSGTLTNYDKGYEVKKEEVEGNKASEDEEAAPQTLVKFGTVTVGANGKFVNAEGARSEGSALVLEAEKRVEIKGTSVWNTLQLSNVGEGKTVSNYVDIVKDDEANVKGDFRVTGALVIDEFAENGDFSINGSTDAEVFADGIDISAGSHVAAGALEQVNAGDGLSWKDDKLPTVGTLKIAGFAATYQPESENPETPEGEAKAETGDDETATGGSWTFKKLGDVSAVNTKLLIDGNRASEQDLQKSYSPSLQMSSLTLGGTTMKIAYDVEVDTIKAAVESAWKKVQGEDAEPIDMEGWSKDNILEEIETLLNEEKYADLKKELEDQRRKLESGDASVTDKGLVGDLGDSFQTLESTIKGSDLSIGTLTLAVKNETVKVELSASDSEKAGNGEGATTQADKENGTDMKPETVTVTGNETYGFKDLSLAVTNSNLDVDTLDVQTGTVTLTGSNMMVGNVKTLNGSLTVSDGYLGLNVTTGVSDDIIKTTGTTVEVGSPVTIGAKGQLNFGTKPATDTRSEGDETPAETEDHAIGFFTDTNIVFDGKNFNSEALFSQDRTDGKKGIVKVDGGSLTVKATNLSWGVYKLFDEDTLDTSALKDVTIDTKGSSASGLWEGATVTSGTEDKNQIVVGGTTIEGSGLDIGAVNLANSVVAGDRGSALDKALFNHILSNGKSLEEISNTINSITAMGAVAGLTAMTVDFGAYVTDQVEHHASTIPHQQEGWWVQPIAGKLKSDDLAVGGMKGGYSIDTVGIMGGFDKKLRNGDTIGVAASYQSGDADSEGEGLPVTTDVTNYGLHLWHARQFDAYRLMGMFSYSKTSGDAKMNYVGNEITSDLGATEISIGARADKEFKWGTVRMIPHAGVRASMIDVDDYTIEMGSEELFKVSEDKLWIFEVPVGVTFASSFEYARWNVQPYVDLTVRGRFGDTDSTFTLEGSNTSDSMKYDVTGDVIGDLRIGYMSTFQDLNLGMSYGLSAGDGGRQNHQIEATLRIDFN